MRFPRHRDEEPEESVEPAPFTSPPIETNTEVHTELHADTPVEADEPAASRWLGAVISLVVLLLVLIGLFLGGRWLYNTIFDESTTTPPQVSGPGTALGSNPSQAEKDKKKDTSSGSTARSNSDTSSPSTTLRTPTTGGELPNSGPGSVLAIFVGASLAGAGLHHIVTLRRRA